jgi:hypothetical protein
MIERGVLEENVLVGGSADVTRCGLERRGSICWEGMLGLAEVGFLFLFFIF